MVRLGSLTGSDEFSEQSTVELTGFSPPPEGVFTFVVAEGPDQGRQWQIDASQPGRVLLGHSESCEIRLIDRQVSRRHAALELVGARLRITDLGSKNGTFVEQVAITDAFLRGDEMVRVGATVLRVTRHNEAARVALPAANHFGRFIGVSTEVRRLYVLFERLAASSVPVIIEGETGTGKEVLAEALHEQGPRASNPFVVLDCTSVPAALLEAELFGHERGSFTGAITDRKGVFEQAQGGTLLIDEIGDLDIALQPKLLRALERSEFRRVGGHRTIRAEVRILVATRRDLDHEVQEGRFRDDLFHRLAVGRVYLPPLRSRRGDVAVLASHFCQALGAEPSSIPPRLLRQWDDYPWPGNVRELRNAVSRQVEIGDVTQMLSGTTDPEPEPDTDAIQRPLGAFVERAFQSKLPLGHARREIVTNFEKAYIARVLAREGGNVSRAATSLGIARRYLQILRSRDR